MTATIDYQKQATDFCAKHELAMKIKRGSGKCPPWANEGARRNSNATCESCASVHGHHYRVTIERKGPDRVWHKGEPGPRRISFDFWGSQRDAMTGQAVTAYDILSNLSGDLHCAETFEDFCGETGYDTDSRKAEAVFKRCRTFADRLGAFFSIQETNDLAEIS